MLIKPWYWLVFGLILILSELVVPSFTIIWFGSAAVLIAGILWLFPGMSLALQLFLWTIASVAMTCLWFWVVKPKMTDRTKAGIALEAIVGETGTVIRPPSEAARGRLRLPAPILGSDEWEILCYEPVAPGDRAVVTGVSGNTLIVKKAGS